MRENSKLVLQMRGKLDYDFFVYQQKNLKFWPSKMAFCPFLNRFSSVKRWPEMSNLMGWKVSLVYLNDFRDLPDKYDCELKLGLSNLIGSTQEIDLSHAKLPNLKVSKTIETSLLFKVHCRSKISERSNNWFMKNNTRDWIVLEKF